MIVVKLDGKEHELGREITIETDGENLLVSDGGIKIHKSYKSVLELLYAISWFIRASDKTKLVLKAGEREFVRKKDYYIGKLRL